MGSTNLAAILPKSPADGLKSYENQQTLRVLFQRYFRAESSNLRPFCVGTGCSVQKQWNGNSFIFRKNDDLVIHESGGFDSFEKSY